jgi:putative oxidoreductase
MQLRRQSPLKKLFATPSDPTLALMRIILAVIFFPHGAQKALGWYGGSGFHGTMHFFTAMMHIPAFFAFLAIVAEFAGSILVFLGFLTRIAAFGQVIVLLVAIFKVALPHGLIGPGGYQFPLALLALAFLLMIKGAGAFSLDRLIARQRA